MKLALQLTFFVFLFHLGSASICQDDPQFRYQRNEEKNCDWIAKHNGCALKHRNGYIVGETFCPVTCNQCDFQVAYTSVRTEQLCYRADQTVEISFDNQNPETEDWLGIYPVSADSTNLGSPIVWSWLCATHDQVCKVSYSAISLQLPPGTFKAVLARRNHGGRYSSYAESTAFQVTSFGEACTARRLLRTTKSRDCQMALQVHKTSYVQEEDVVVTMEQCDAEQDDFVAIYDADTDLDDIRGDANYRVWMWACGTQFCHQAVESSVFAFGPDNNRYTWPLPPGSYQAHLVKRNQETDAFASAAVSAVFTVEDEGNGVSTEVARRLHDCLDSLVSRSSCYEEGEAITVLLHNECSSLTHKDWIGFYLDEPNKDPDDYFFGDPIMWTRACRGDCSSSSTKYNFKASNELLPVGTYRVVLVGKGYRHGGPYEARMISDSLEIHASGEPCVTKAKDIAS